MILRPVATPSSSRRKAMRPFTVTTDLPAACNLSRYMTTIVRVMAFAAGERCSALNSPARSRVGVLGLVVGPALVLPDGQHVGEASGRRCGGRRFRSRHDTHCAAGRLSLEGRSKARHRRYAAHLPPLVIQCHSSAQRFAHGLWPMFGAKGVNSFALSAVGGYKVLGDAAAEVVDPAPFDDVHLSAPV